MTDGFTASDREKLTEVHTDMKHLKDTSADHETRIRKNEKTVIIVGAVPLIVGLIVGIKKLFMT